MCTIMKLFCPHSVYALRMIPAIDTDCSPTYVSFTDRVSVTVTNHVHCEIRSEVLYVYILDERQSSKGLTD